MSLLVKESKARPESEGGEIISTCRQKNDMHKQRGKLLETMPFETGYQGCYCSWMFMLKIQTGLAKFVNNNTGLTLEASLF